MMTVRQLMVILEGLNPQASVTVVINGTLFDLGGVGANMHEDALSPHVVLDTNGPYPYGRGPR